MFGDIFYKKRVWVSGHTGFKGSWLSEWLLGLGAEVFGFALAPDTSPSLFQQLNLASRLHHELGDVRDAEAVRESLLRADPDFVFYLAAQPLVRRSYAMPVETYETNVNGTIHVLEALRSLRKPCTAIFVTTDKCYENREHGFPYKEEDHLGGRDPYSSSKAMAEIAVAAYRQSYFESPSSPVRVATARAGNVIGGGDWAEDRIVPDCIRSLKNGAAIQVRNPSATRPWQHVLEPLGGYLWHAAALAQDLSAPSALNFGPNPDCNRSVRQLVEQILQHWPGTWVDGSESTAVHEAKLLSLSIEKAWSTLRWRPVWDFAQTIARTVEWYRSDHHSDSACVSITRSQIQAYCSDAAASGIAWSA
jgi:CDP-glucose 4,6-dehydratase